MKEILFDNEKNVTIEEMTVSVGSVNYKQNAVLLKAGETLQFALFTTEDLCLLEIEELHKREQGVFAYAVDINDKTVYFRSYEPCADAPNGCFIRLPDEVLGKEVTVTVRMEFSFVAISAVRLHSASILNGECEKMLAGFFTPPYSAANRQISVEAVEKIRDTFDKNGSLVPMVAFEIAYMNRSDREISEQLKFWLSVASETKVPLFINLNSWWGGTPGGPDGKGGYFGDTEYQQICFDPSTGEYNLSVPNMWSNTPWLTMNHPVLNEVRKQRLSAVLGLVQRIVSLHSLETEPNDIRIFLDNEPAYWASFAYGGDADSGGDFSPFVRRDALLDGVELPVGAPLEDNHRKWLLKNMNNYIDGLCQVCYEQRFHEPVIIKNGEEQESNNTASKIYTHVFPFASYPFMDMQNPQWETHVTQYANLGIESSTVEDSRILDYAVRMGSFSNINSERACMHDYDVFIQDHMYGADACMIFNYRKEDASEVAKIGNQIKLLEFCERDFPIPKLTFDVFKNGLDFPEILKTENIATTKLQKPKGLALSKSRNGKNTINAGHKKDYGENLTVELWCFSHAETGSISLSVGTTPEAKRRSVYIAEHGNEGSPVLTDVPISDFSDEDTVWLLVEITNTTINADWCMLNYIWKMRLMKRFDTPAGHTSGFRFTAEQTRKLNRFVSKRADEIKFSRSTVSDTYLLSSKGTVKDLSVRYDAEAPVFVKYQRNGHEELITLSGKACSKITFYGVTAYKIGLNSWRIERGSSDSVLAVEKENLPKTVSGRYGGINCGKIKIF